MKATFLLTLSLACLLAACASQQPQPDTAGVLVLPQNRVTHCRKLGKAKVTALHSFAIWTLYPADVEANLAARAKARAAQAGADTAVPLTRPDNGKQTFGLYHCVGGMTNRQQANVPQHNSSTSDRRKKSATVTTKPYRPYQPPD
jgi:hypothetical protein